MLYVYIEDHQLQKALTCDTCNRLWSYHYHKTNTSSIIWNTDKFSIDFLHGIIHDRTYCLRQNIKRIFSAIFMTNLLNSIFITLPLLPNAINLLGVENTPQPWSPPYTAWISSDTMSFHSFSSRLVVTFSNDSVQ